MQINSVLLVGQEAIVVPKLARIGAVSLGITIGFIGCKTCMLINNYKSKKES